MTNYVDSEKAVVMNRLWELTDYGEWVHLTWLDRTGLHETCDIIFLAYSEDAPYKGS